LTVRLEADDRLAVDHQRGRRPALPVIDQLVIGVRVRLDVLALVGDALLPKELFGRPAIPSAGLVVQDDLLHWMSSLSIDDPCRNLRSVRCALSIRFHLLSSAIHVPPLAGAHAAMSRRRFEPLGRTTACRTAADGDEIG
jgi:hypothetical protein